MKMVDYRRQLTQQDQQKGEPCGYLRGGVS